MILLDTDVLSATRRPDRAPPVAAWLSRHVGSEIFVSVISFGEVERGIARQVLRNPPFAEDLREWLSRVMARYADQTLNFGLEEARVWGRLAAEVGHQSPDLMIAATALTRGLTVATRNVAHFEPTGVRVVNPYDP